MTTPLTEQAASTVVGDLTSHKLLNVANGTADTDGVNTAQMNWVYNTLSTNISNLSGRNKVINGDFRVNQRTYVSGTATTGANQYTFDRWRVVVSGQSVTFAASGNGNLLTVPAGGYEQVIEGINIEGGTFVLNWTGTATATVNGTAVAKGATATLPANTNATLRFSSGTLGTVQLESGTVATPFERRPYGAELTLCQRYYQDCAYGLSGTFNSGSSYSATIALPVTMRAIPTAMYGSSYATNNFPTGSPTYTMIANNWGIATKAATATGNAGFLEHAWFSAEL